MPLSQLPALVSACFADISAALDRHSAPRLLRLLVDILFAKGRRTVTSWFRAAGITRDFRPAYNSLWATGRRAEALAHRLLCVAPVDVGRPKVEAIADFLRRWLQT
jgi:hypothetical protein